MAAKKATLGDVAVMSRGSPPIHRKSIDEVFYELKAEMTPSEMRTILGFFIQEYPDDARIMLRQLQLEGIDKQ
jgi:hypothetical protein